jgi:DNA-binding SARP family transcriptional activator
LAEDRPPGAEDDARQAARDALVLRIELLGRPRWRNGNDAWCELSAQDAALLALLALEGPCARDELAGQIWPESNQQQAANNLRKHISRLRAASGHPTFDAGATVRLLDDVRVDARELAQVAVEFLHDGDLLAGCDYSGNEYLRHWVEARRQALRMQRGDALAGHAEALERNGELAAAIRLAERIVELAPSLEVAWRRLMRLHYLRGDHTAAVSAFERFEHWQREQTGARPGPETLRLLATIERGAQARSAPQRRLPVSLVRPPKRVGREAQWLAMQRAWSAGRAFLLVGDAGIGKTRLLEEAAAQHLGVLSERARPGDAQAPYTLLARLIRAALARPGVQTDAHTRQELARLVPELGPVPQAAAQEAQLHHAVECLLLAVAEAGVVAVLLDDLHFADLATLEALRWLGASAALRALHFGLAARALDEGPVEALLRAWLLDSQRPERISLEPLAPAEVVELLSSLDLPQFAAPEIAARLHLHTGGHPLFTLETLKDAWLHDRDLRSDTLPRPQTVRALILGRLRELPSQAMDLVRVAAVAGVDLDAHRAARLLDVGPLMLADAWGLLEKAHILQEQRFAHDLMQECALELVPLALRKALHGVIAEMLGDDTRVPAARVAEHWQAAQRWAEAGQWWHRAGLAARRAGRLQEQQALLERAAVCHRQAGDTNAEFESVRAAFDGLLLRHGGGAVLAAMVRLEALASNATQRLECHLLEAEALLDGERSREALEVAAIAVELAGAAPARMGDALCLQAMALAQEGHVEKAVRTARRAADAAHAAGDAAQELRAVRSLAYSLYIVGHLGEALAAQQRAADLANALGDEAESAAAEASIAALQAAAGDVPASFARAASAGRRYEVMGLAQNSTVGTANLLVWGTSAAYLGNFEEALRLLQAALRMAGDDATVSAQAKARISLANVWLTLGESGAARPLAASMPPGAPPGVRMQAALILARAEQLEGGDGHEHFGRLARLGAEHPDVPLMQSAWVEWSYQGTPSAALARLGPLREQIAGLGLPGAARSVQLREIDRLLDCGDRASRALASSHARELLPHIEAGMHAKTYPPEGWAVLARAFDVAGEIEQAAHCRREAVAWIRNVALPRVPEAWRETFLWRNPINRAHLGAAP